MSTKAVLRSAARYDDPATHYPCDEEKMDICDFIYHRMVPVQTSTIRTEIAGTSIFLADATFADIVVLPELSKKLVSILKLT